MNAATRILIAEDETLIRLDLRTQLEDAGYTVCGEARDGAEAVELAATTGPDVVLLDVKMPVLDGVEAARRIAAAQSLPIVFVTAYGDRALVERVAGTGAFAFLTKPFRPADLMAAIELATARHAELQGVREEAAGLADALEARKSIERAKGLLMEREGLSESEAFLRLRQASQNSGHSMKTIADTINAALS
jgi:two-component system, response regulator PdtaR